SDPGGSSHLMCVFVWVKSTHGQRLRTLAVSCVGVFSLRTLRSRLTLFSRGEMSTSVPGGSGPARAEAERRLYSWGSQVELAAEFERGDTVPQSQAAGGDELLDDDDAISLTSSDPGASALLTLSPREQVLAMEEREAAEVASFPSKPPCPAYVELLEVVERAAGRLQLPWCVRESPFVAGKTNGFSPTTAL
ncbi:MAG: hypothetical protein ACRCZO_09705, partial [Cetobacterium sp.]